MEIYRIKLYDSLAKRSLEQDYSYNNVLNHRNCDFKFVPIYNNTSIQCCHWNGTRLEHVQEF
jgi:hypothetical protein